MALTPTELKMWRARLEHSHRVWEAKGLTGRQHRTLLRYVDAYRNVYSELEGWGGLDIQIVPVVFKFTNTFLAMISARNPEVMVRPRSRPEIAGAARITELVLNYFVDELRMKRQWDKVVRDAALLPAGFLRHGFTPSLEKLDDQGREIESYAQARADMPWVRRWPIWDVRIDPMAETWNPDEDARWAGFRSLTTMDRIKRNPNLKVRDDLKPSKTYESEEWKSREDRQNPPPEEAELVETWTIYDREERKWFTLATGAEKEIREADDWPLGWEDLPYDVLYFNDQVNDSRPIAFAEAYWPMAEEKIKTRTLMSEGLKRTRRIITWNPQALSDGEAKKIRSGELRLVEFFETQDGASPESVFHETALGQFPAEALVYDDRIEQELREILGQSLMDRAQRINVETAEEAGGVRLGSAVQQSRPQQRFEEFLASVVRHFHQGLQSPGVLDEALLIDILGLSDARAALEFAEFAAGDGFLRVPPEAIRGEFRYKIRVGSTLPKDHDREIGRLLALRQATQGDTGVDQREITRLLIEEFGYSADRLQISEEQQRQSEALLAQSEAAQGNGRGTAGPGGGDLTNVVRNLTAQQSGGG